MKDREMPDNQRLPAKNSGAPTECVPAERVPTSRGPSPKFPVRRDSPFGGIYPPSFVAEPPSVRRLPDDFEILNGIGS
jgi:hypothetical protein